MVRVRPPPQLIIKNTLLHVSFGPPPRCHSDQVPPLPKRAHTPPHTYLLMRDNICAARLVPPLPHIPIADDAVPATGAEYTAIPSNTADAVSVPNQLSDLLGTAGIPDLDLWMTTTSFDGLVTRLVCG